MDKQENIYLSVNDLSAAQVEHMCTSILAQSNQVLLFRECTKWLHDRHIQFYVSSVIEPGKGFIYHASTSADLPEVEGTTFDEVFQRLIILVYLGMMTGRIHDNSAVQEPIVIQFDDAALEVIKKAQNAPVEPPPAPDNWAKDPIGEVVKNSTAGDPWKVWTDNYGLKGKTIAALHKAAMDQYGGQKTTCSHPFVPSTEKDILPDSSVQP